MIPLLPLCFCCTRELLYPQECIPACLVLCGVMLQALPVCFSALELLFPVWFFQSSCPPSPLLLCWNRGENTATTAQTFPLAIPLPVGRVRHCVVRAHVTRRLTVLRCGNCAGVCWGMRTLRHCRTLPTALQGFLETYQCPAFISALLTAAVPLRSSSPPPHVHSVLDTRQNGALRVARTHNAHSNLSSLRWGVVDGLLSLPPFP